MSSNRIKILVMAAGTGGHVFPALSIANLLMSQSIQVEWLGTPKGMENQLLSDTEIPLHKISVTGLRGSGFAIRTSSRHALCSAPREKKSRILSFASRRFVESFRNNSSENL